MTTPIAPRVAPKSRKSCCVVSRDAARPPARPPMRGGHLEGHAQPHVHEALARGSRWRRRRRWRSPRSGSRRRRRGWARRGRGSAGAPGRRRRPGPASLPRGPSGPPGEDQEKRRAGAAMQGEEHARDGSSLESAAGDGRTRLGSPRTPRARWLSCSGRGSWSCARRGPSCPFSRCPSGCCPGGG